MTRKEIKELLPILQAFAEGKTIECSFNDEPWAETNNLLFCGGSKYRIKSDKSEPKYRAFKNQEECWNEMLKHQPFGWIRNTYTKRFHNIDSIGHTTYGITLDNNCITDFDVAFDAYNFADGTPFGIKSKE